MVLAMRRLMAPQPHAVFDSAATVTTVDGYLCIESGDHWQIVIAPKDIVEARPVREDGRWWWMEGEENA
jgi:hypothetical protein